LGCSAALNALTGLIVSAPNELREQLSVHTTTGARATLCARMRPDHARLHEPVRAAKASLRSIARRVIELDAELTALDRHRLNYGGGRDANRALHDRRLPPALLPAHPPIRRAPHHEGKTKTEIIRCLKRYIAREIYHALRAHLDPTATNPRQPGPIVSITCGAGPIGRTTRAA
jgi:hypothetical protein